MIGRVHQGVQLQQVRQELAMIAQHGMAEFPRPQWASLRSGFVADTLQSDLAKDIRPAMLAVVGAAVALLAIACVNVTNLLLARGIGRRAELGVRVAIGASRSRLIQQLLTETLLLASIGGVIGILLAYSAVGAVGALIPPELPRAGAIRVEATVLAFAIGLTTLVGLLIGIVPALHRRTGFDLRERIQGSSKHFTGGYQLTRRTLVVVQVALSAVLLANGGLLLRSLQNLFAVPRGFDSSKVLTMQIQTAFKDPNTTQQYFTDVLEAVRHLNGVSEASLTSELPLSGDSDTWGVHLDPSLPRVESADPSAYRYAVSAGYFETMKISLKQGRVLNSRDVAGTPMAIVISESFAKRRLPGLNPIGQKLQIGANTSPWYSVVGVVADTKQTSLEVDQADAVYITQAQWTAFSDRARWLVVRTELDPAQMTTGLRRTIRSIDKNQPILRVATMEERVAASEARRRLALLLFEAFGAGALALAAIGTYSLLAGNVTERTREIGIRIAIGASQGSILSLVLRQGMTVAGIGMTLGITGAMVASRALVTMLYGVTRLDVPAYAGVIVLLAGVSAIACGMPAWRAAKIRPSIALRSE